MKKLTTIVSLFLLILFVSSCENEKSLQAYLVDSSNNDSFMYGDIPVGLMLNPKEDASAEAKETIKSIKKINATFFKKTDDNDAAYETEKTKLKNIFTSKEYKSLGSVKFKGMNMNLFYTGETDEIDEIIAFGYGKNIGVGVARLLGKNMNPARVLDMMNNIKLDIDGIDLNQFKSIFKGK